MLSVGPRSESTLCKSWKIYIVVGNGNGRTNAEIISHNGHAASCHGQPPTPSVSSVQHTQLTVTAHSKCEIVCDGISRLMPKRKTQYIIVSRLPMEKYTINKCTAKERTQHCCNHQSQHTHTRICQVPVPCPYGLLQTHGRQQSTEATT